LGWRSRRRPTSRRLGSRGRHALGWRSRGRPTSRRLGSRGWHALGWRSRGRPTSRRLGSRGRHALGWRSRGRPTSRRLGSRGWHALGWRSRRRPASRRLGSRWRHALGRRSHRRHSRGRLSSLRLLHARWGRTGRRIGTRGPALRPTGWLLIRGGGLGCGQGRSENERGHRYGELHYPVLQSVAGREHDIEPPWTDMATRRVSTRIEATVNPLGMSRVFAPSAFGLVGEEATPRAVQLGSAGCLVLC
jgi:hypothetical protein